MSEKKEGEKPRAQTFPDGFLWGAATASHQVEGNTHNDWTEWEKKNAERLAREAKNRFGHLPNWKDIEQEATDPNNYISGIACDHYRRFEEDFDIAENLGHNAHRFSLEWSRIEPEEGRFDEKEIEHYRNVVKALRERGMEPFVTLWHWTSPEWLMKYGGWTSGKASEFFVRFVEKVVSELKNDVRFWIVINEPNVHLALGFLRGKHPPGHASAVLFVRAFFNLRRAYRRASEVIHTIDARAKVGFAHSFVDQQADLWKPIDWILCKVIIFFRDYFLSTTITHSDFIGCNYYGRSIVASAKNKNIRPSITDLGWEIYPEGLFNVLARASKYGLPLYITENGLADAHDKKRAGFITEHLRQMKRAIENGIDVRGYLHWSLMDNFEFPEVRGFWPRFGLVEVDRNTLERKIRPSALVYKSIIEKGTV